VAALRSAGGVTGVLVGGFVAGVLDIVYAFVAAGRRGASPLRVRAAGGRGHSTVTLFARLRGWSTSAPRRRPMK